MAGPGSVDPASPFFSSIASQAAIQSGAAHAGANRKKEKTGIKNFERLLRTEVSDIGKSEELYIPAHLVGLSPEKILEALLDEVHSAGDKLKEKQLPDNIVGIRTPYGPS